MLFKEKKCICGLKLKDVEVMPNPNGDYFCPVCGRDLTPIKGKAKPEAEEAAPSDE